MVIAAANSKAVSPLIATVLTILLGVTMLAIVLNVVNPMFRRAQDTSVVTDAFQNLEMLNTAIEGVSSEAQGSKRTVSLSATGGTYRVNSTYDWLYFEYEPQEDLRLTGTKGNVYVERGLEFADYFNYYVDGSKATPAWTNISGQWTASDYKYSGQNGLAYHNVSGPFENWKFSASISNVSGPTGGQVFVLPTNPESLVGFWPFDNRSGSVAYDYSGNRNNGTLTNMNTTGNATSGWQTAANCKGGNSCLKFDGKNDIVNCNNDSSLNTTTVTVAAWVKRNVIGVRHAIYADSGPSGSDAAHFLWFEIFNNNKLFLLFGDGITAADKFSTNTITDTNWHHVVLIRDDTNKKVTFFIDGVQDSGGWQSYSGNIVSKGTYSMWIGAGGYSGGWAFFNGTIDEVMVFNRSLSADEVKALYELSAKKLDVTGTRTITAKTNVSVVLSNPAGRTKFDNIKVTREQNILSLIIPYDNIDINGTLRAGKGGHQIEITHMGTSAASNRPVIQITAV